MERDEFGIPTGEHTLTCGCEMKGRAITKLCDQHLDTITTNYYMMPLLSPEERGRRILGLVEEGVRESWTKEQVKEIDRNARAYGWEVGSGKEAKDVIEASPDNPYLKEKNDGNQG